MSVLGVILHDMSHDRMRSDRFHGFGDGLKILADAISKAPAKEDDFHGLPSLCWDHYVNLGNRNEDLSAPACIERIVPLGIDLSCASLLR